MANTLLILEAANLYMGDDDPQNSKHLTLDEISLPDLQAVYAAHHPGGSFVEMEIEVGVSKLVASFKLKGWDPQALGQFGLGSKKNNVYTVYGMLRDKIDGSAKQVKAIMRARLGGARPDGWSRGQLQGFQYQLSELTHYQLHVDNSEVFYWDWAANIFRTGGQDQNADLNRILRIPNVTG